MCDFGFYTAYILRIFHFHKPQPYYTDIDYYNAFAPWLQYIQVNS